MKSKEVHFVATFRVGSQSLWAQKLAVFSTQPMEDLVLGSTDSLVRGLETQRLLERIEAAQGSRHRQLTAEVLPSHRASLRSPDAAIRCESRLPSLGKSVTREPAWA